MSNQYYSKLKSFPAEIQRNHMIVVAVEVTLLSKAVQM